MSVWVSLEDSRCGGRRQGCDKDAPILQATLVTPQKGHSHSWRKWDLGPLWAGNQRQEAWGPRGVGTPRALFGWSLHNTVLSWALGVHAF